MEGISLSEIASLIQNFPVEILHTSRSRFRYSKDIVHVVWYGYGWGYYYYYGSIHYRVRTSSGWQPQEAVTDKNAHQYSPAVAVDSKDNVHVVWSGSGWGNSPSYGNIQYNLRTPGGVWQTQVGLTDLAYYQQYPVLIWAEWPDPPVVRTDVPRTGYALVYSGLDATGYKVVYLASSDLTWGTKLPVGGTVVAMPSAPVLVLAAFLAAISAVYIAMRRTRANS